MSREIFHMTYLDHLTPPVSVTIFTNQERTRLSGANERWSASDVSIDTRLAGNSLSIDVRAEKTLLERIHLRWNLPAPTGLRLLGDHWERGYGDLEWRGILPERVMPWYFLAYDGQKTRGCGVKTGAGALCFWMFDANGVSLWLDVRCGGLGVDLRGRTLRAAEVVLRPGLEGETPFNAARAFCRLLCDNPRLPQQPVYGSNNWYYAYGRSSHAEILSDARLLSDLAPGGANRPYMVIDAGWQPLSGDDEVTNVIAGGPYTGSNPRFPDMARLASEIRSVGARPGIWIRPLEASQDDPAKLLLPVARAVDASAKTPTFDPSIPEVLEHIRANFARLRAWGYELIKHDWATCDLLGRWGFQMSAALTTPGWRFYDATRTTAEITRGLYQAIRAGAGDAVVIGCNTMGHLGAGLFELQRTGDDTSGQEWERTRKYGINTLAFRAPQHGTFFAVDADCVGHTQAIPWELNARWLDLLARSGTPLFVSIDPRSIDAEQARALKTAYAAAAQPQPLGEPLDWMDTTCPAIWKLGEETVRYDWVGEEGAKPNAPSIPLWWGS
jgi:alpha-galactosidase